MADNMEALEEWVGPLLAQLDVKQRRALARNVARDLRRRQRERIRAQTNPDGTPYAPRKEQRLRAQQGSIKRHPPARPKRSRHPRRPTRGVRPAGAAGVQHS